MALGAALGIGGAVLGGLAGAAGQSATRRTVLAPAGATEVAGEQLVLRQLPQLEQLVGVGPGQQDVTAGLAAQRGLGDMLAQFAQGGFLPGQQDFATARQFAQDAFQPQAVALRQSFEGEQQRTAQLAAQLGRPVNDPILQARLAQEQMRAQERLGAAQSAFSSEFALSLPQQRLGYTGQLADVRSGLASQAMANRQALLSLGSQLQGQGQQFRASTASQTMTQGGGLGGAISGALAGFGTGLGVSQMFGGGGQAASQGFQLGAPMPANTGNFGALTGMSSPGFVSNANPFRAQTFSAAPAYSGPLSPSWGGTGLDMSFGVPNMSRMAPAAPSAQAAPNPVTGFFPNFGARY